MASTKIDKRKVEFTLQAPGARSVQLAGDFTDWEKAPKPLRKLKDGVWKCTVSLPEGYYEYRLLVDGQWQSDPANPLVSANPFGSHNSVRLVV